MGSITSEMLPQAVDLLALDLPEALALRAVLELYQVRVNLFTVGRGTDVLSALNGDAPHLVISAHGDRQGFVLSELDPEEVPDHAFYGHLTPVSVRTQPALRGRVVIATACDSGSPTFVEAFLDAGAAAYVAPVGAPTDAIFFLVHLYYGLVWGQTLPGAVQWARAHDIGDSRLFRLFKR
ncbi:MAG: hypothetical protein DLM67_07090 [Candidatus Nephthysia bennettiae]|nr:MAG: hypothetical protein DLM67_07090 [Candidatus Dormibacteraeota bacterium]